MNAATAAIIFSSCFETFGFMIIMIHKFEFSHSFPIITPVFGIIIFRCIPNIIFTSKWDYWSYSKCIAIIQVTTIYTPGIKELI